MRSFNLQLWVDRLEVYSHPMLCFAIGSAAAGMQAGIGNVVAGSLFAGAQSVAAGGALPAIGSVISAGISGGIGYLATPGKK